MTDANLSGGKEPSNVSRQGQVKLSPEAKERLMSNRAQPEPPQGEYSTEPPTHSELTPEQETSVLKAVAEALRDFKAFPASDNHSVEGNNPVDPDPNTTGEEDDK